MNIIDSFRVKGIDYLLKDSTVAAQLQLLEQSLVQRIQAIIGTAPEELDTLKEIADALGNNNTAIESILQVVAEKASKAYVDQALSTISLTPGPQGPKGDSFTFEDFTPELLESLRGPKGDTGTFDSSDLESYATKLYVDGYVNGIKLQKISQANYDVLENKDSNTLYIIEN